MTPIPIVALDVPDTARAMSMIGQIGDSCGFFKIGSELFTSAGPSVVDAVRGEGKQVFLDLKFHDIPNTVRAAARSASAGGASLITVHALGGRAMIEAAVEGAGSTCRVLAVTILTSMDASAASEAVGREVVVSDEVTRLAELARSSGAHGVVCSGQEAGRIRREFGPDFGTLVPGIRLAGDSAGDQSRIVTPRAAAEAGATYIILGRTVTAGGEPRLAMRRVLDELSASGV